MTDPNPAVEAVARVLVDNYPVAGTSLIAMQWWATEVARDVVAALQRDGSALVAEMHIDDLHAQNAALRCDELEDNQ